MYVLDYQKQIALIKEMVQLRKNDEKWEAYYHHPSTNEMWKSFFPKANGKKRGPKVMRKEPVPNELEKRINLCLKDGGREDATGLSIELSTEPDKWEQIFKIVDENYRKYDLAQIKTFFNNLGVYDFEGLFDELEYELDQFGLDENEMKKLIWKARKIKAKKMILFW